MQTIAPVTREKPSIISDIRDKDHEGIVSLFKRARLSADRTVVPGYIESAIAENYFEKALQRYVKGAYGASVLRKASLNGQLLGFYMVGKADAYPELEGQAKGLRGELHWLYVEPVLKRRGIGTKLFQSAARALNELCYDNIIINAIDGRDDAQAFYKVMGMRTLVHRQEKNVRDGKVFDVPCILMGHENLSAYVQGLQPVLTRFGARNRTCALVAG